MFAERHDNPNPRVTSDTVTELLGYEAKNGYQSERAYCDLQDIAEQAKNNFLKFLISAKEEGKSVCAFGAAAKGNTFINFSGIRPDLIQAVGDSNPAKQGKFMPGSRIPIVSEKEIANSKPDYIVILPWNLKEEIVGRLSYMNSWGCRFVVAIPDLQII